MGKKTIHHMDFETLADVNKQVVALTGEPHEYTLADGEKLAGLIQEVGQRADNEEPEEAIPEKAALLVFKVASGQYFHAGNQRTALVAGSAFLSRNGYALDIKNTEFATAVDKAGIAAVTLDELYEAMEAHISKAKTDRRRWESVVAAVVEANKDFLTRLAS